MKRKLPRVIAGADAEFLLNGTLIASASDVAVLGENTVIHAMNIKMEEDYTIADLRMCEMTVYKPITKEEVTIDSKGILTIEGKVKETFSQKIEKMEPVKEIETGIIEDEDEEEDVPEKRVKASEKETSE